MSYAWLSPDPFLSRPELAIAGPTALRFGLLAVGFGVAFAGPFWFLLLFPWIPLVACLAVFAIVFGFLLHRVREVRAQGGNDAAASQTTSALRAFLASAGVTAALCAILLVTLALVLRAPAAWHFPFKEEVLLAAGVAACCLSYGIGLISMARFAPRSIHSLGAFFCIFAIFVPLLTLLAGSITFGSAVHESRRFFFVPGQIPAALIALSFGLFHLGFALRSRLRQTQMSSAVANQPVRQSSAFDQSVSRNTRLLSPGIAAIIGLAALAFASWLYLRWRPLPEESEDLFARWLIGGWLAVLAVGALGQCLLCWRQRRAPDRLLGPRTFLAIALILPGAIGLWESWASRGDLFYYFLPCGWMLSYGLGLLSTGPYAPIAESRLGWCFLAASVGSFFLLALLTATSDWDSPASHLPTASNVLMAIAFGVFHLFYAACTSPRAKQFQRTNS